MRGQHLKALGLYQQARGEFAALKLQQDELRSVRAIVDLQLKGTQPQTLPQSIERLIQLGDQVTRTERESAAAARILGTTRHLPPQVLLRCASRDCGRRCEARKHSLPPQMPPS